MPRLRLSPTVWMLLALVLLTALWRWLLASPARVVWGDEPFYLWIGRNWLTGRGYTFTGYSDVHHTAGYPLLSGLLYLVTGNLELASRLLFVIFGALLPLPIYGLAARLYGRGSGLLAALLVAVWPALNGAVLNWGTLTEPPYYFFIYSGLFVAMTILLPNPERSARPGLARRVLPWFATAALLTLAYHVRPEAIAHVLAVGGYLILVAFIEARRRRLTLLPRVAAYALSFALLWLPYGAYVAQHTGSWQISEKAGVTYVTSKSLAYGDTKTFDRATWGLDSTGREVFFFSHESYNVSMVDTILADPGDFARLLYQNVEMFLDQTISNRLFPFFLLPLVALGWFGAPWETRRLKGEGLLWVGILPVLAFLLFFIQERYIATLLPILIVWTAHGLNRFGAWLSISVERIARRHLPGPRRSALAFAPVAVLVLLFLITTPRVMASTSVGSWRPGHRLVGIWLRPVAHGAIIMSRYPAMVFHANAAKWVATPNAEIEAVRPYALDKQARYWVIDERELSLRPQFRPLVEGQAPAWLRLIHREGRDGERIVVYEIVP